MVDKYFYKFQEKYSYHWRNLEQFLIEKENHFLKTVNHVYWGCQGCRARAEVAIRLTIAGKVYSQHPRSKELISSYRPLERWGTEKKRARTKCAYGLFNVNVTSSNWFSPTRTRLYSSLWKRRRRKGGRKKRKFQIWAVNKMKKRGREFQLETSDFSPAIFMTDLRSIISNIYIYAHSQNRPFYFHRWQKLKKKMCKK